MPSRPFRHATIQCAAAFALITAIATAAPKIEFKETTHDFGRVRDNTVVQHDYSFTNRGTTPLEITAVVPSCGCTTTPDWSREVAPGDSGVIPLIFNSAGMLGEVNRTLAVHTNDPDQPVVVLTLKSTVWMPIELHPSAAIIQMPPHSSDTFGTAVMIVNRMEAPLKIEQPRSTLPELQVELHEIEAGREYHLLIKIDAPEEHKDLNGIITMATSSEEFPELTVPVIVIAQPEMIVSPAQMFLPVIPPDFPEPYIVTVRNQGKNEITIENAASDVPGGTVEVRETHPGREFQLAISIPTDLEYDPEAQFTVTARTSHPDYPEIRVNLAFANPPNHMPRRGRGGD